MNVWLHLTSKKKKINFSKTYERIGPTVICIQIPNIKKVLRSIPKLSQFRYLIWSLSTNSISRNRIKSSHFPKPRRKGSLRISYRKGTPCITLLSSVFLTFLRFSELWKQVFPDDLRRSRHSAVTECGIAVITGVYRYTVTVIRTKSW